MAKDKKRTWEELKLAFDEITTKPESHDGKTTEELAVIEKKYKGIQEEFKEAETFFTNNPTFKDEIEGSDYLKVLTLESLMKDWYDHKMDKSPFKANGKRLNEREFKELFQIKQGAKQIATALGVASFDLLLLFALNQPLTTKLTCIGLSTISGAYFVHSIGSQKPPPYTYVPYKLEEIVRMAEDDKKRYSDKQQERS